MVPPTAGQPGRGLPGRRPGAPGPGVCRGQPEPGLPLGYRGGSREGRAFGPPPRRWTPSWPTSSPEPTWPSPSKPGSGWRRGGGGPALLAIFRRYPIRGAYHPPPPAGTFYRGPVRQGAFQYAVDHCDLPCVTMGTSSPPRPAGSWPPSSPPSPTDGRPGLVYNPAPGPKSSKGANP